MQGSFMNRVMETATDAVQAGVKVGDGATLTFYTDRAAATVIEVTPKKIVVREDFALRTDGNGMSESQTYAYAPNPNGKIWVFTLRKNGRFYAQGEKWGSGTGLVTGMRRHYHDFGF